LGVVSELERLVSNICRSRFLPLLGLGLMTAWPASAWGPVAQQALAARAIDTLPRGLKEFYHAHRYELPTLALEGKIPEDGPEQRFLLDRLLPFPFADLPVTEEAFKARFGEEPARVGRLPWLIQESYARLVEAFKGGDKQTILNESDALAALVAQLDNPLAFSDNFDGQKTGQHGLWVRFTVRLPEAMEKRLKLDPDAAAYIDDPKRYVFALAAGAYVWLDNLLYEEELAKRGHGGYTELYYEAFERRVGAMLKTRLSRAATDVGSYWYTAWSAAGHPALK
jgi:hypothetical protein